MSTPRPVALHVAEGTGRLCRTEHGVLFVPEPDDGIDALLRAARSPEAGSEGIGVIAAALAAQDLQAPACVYVTWHPRVAVLVFGAVELRTDHPAVPMLTGAGSQTWVEHSIPTAAGEVELLVSPPQDTDTDLVAGTVPAAGFRLLLAVQAEDPSAPPAAPHVAAPPATSPPAAPPPAAAPGADGAAEPAATEPAASRPPSSGDESWRPPSADASDPDAALSAIQAAAVDDEPPAGTRPTAAVGDEPSATASPASPPEATTRISAPAEPHVPPPSQEPRDDPEPDPRGLVEAVACSNGHANPPGRDACRSCDALLAPGAALTTMPRPTLGTIRFDDGDTVDLDGDLVLGRRPEPSPDAHTVVVEGNRISRTHATIILRGWEVLLRDERSRNGTFVVGPGGDDEPVCVEPDVPVRLEPATTVYLGTRSFVLLEPSTR